LRFVSAVCLASVVLAQTPSEPKPAVVEGKVINSLNGEAIRKAELVLTNDLTPDGADNIGWDVRAMAGDAPDIAAPPKPKQPKKTFTATSDAAGKFRFEQVEPGDYFFSVKHAGFVDLMYKAIGPMRAADGLLHLKAGQEVTALELRMIPQGAVAGKVVDEDGDPVTNAMVTAESVDYSSGRRKLQLRDSGATNDRGEFRLGKLPPGRYYISAEIMSMDAMRTPPPPPKDGLPETGYVCTYFPKMTDSALAEAVDVKAGSDVPGLTIEMQKSRVVRVKGTLVGDDGKPLKGAQVMLMSASRPASMRMIMSNDPEGKFELANVTPGAYTAMIMQLQDQKMIQQALVVPNENLSDVKLGVVTQGMVRGRVNLTGDGKVALKGLSVLLIADGDAPIMPAAAAVDDSGALLLKNVAATTYELNVQNVPAGAYVKSVLWNGKEKLGEPLDFTAGFPGDLQVFLGTDGGKFDVRVSRDDKPVSDATVVLLPDDPSKRNPEAARSESTDDAGHVSFQDVAPGNYLAIAWEKVEDGDWFDPVVVKAAGNYAVRVSIGPKDNQHADLKAIAAKQ
jgi:uncharacterized GH25 family protein